MIYAWITGFGARGPKVEQPATDSVMQSYAGLMSINRDKDGTPQRVNMLALDFATGLYAYQAVASALYRQAVKGKGAYIETSLLASGLVFQEAAIIESFLQGGTVEPIGMPVGTFKTLDGYMTINARRQPHFEQFCKLLSRPEWIADPRFKDPRARVANGDALMALLRPIIETKTTADWSTHLAAIDVLHAAIQTHHDLFNNDQVKAIGALTWVDDPTLGRIPMGAIAGQRAPASGDRLSRSPGLGEHSREILMELGFAGVPANHVRHELLHLLERRRRLDHHRRSRRRRGGALGRLRRRP